MIHEAKRAGANCVKIQLYDPKVVFGDPPENKELFSDMEWEAIYKSRLTRRQLFWIKAECERVSIELLSSVSDLERLQWLEEIGIKRYKIASDDAMNEELCRAIIGKGKPVLVSNGHLGLKRPKYLSGSTVEWLYCISEYPNSLHSLRFIQEGRSIFSFPTISYGEDNYYGYTGFSDHTIGINAAIVAMSLGARIIEKHFTLEKTLPGPDHVCSVDPEELRSLCEAKDDVERILYKDQ